MRSHRSGFASHRWCSLWRFLARPRLDWPCQTSAQASAGPALPPLGGEGERNPLDTFPQIRPSYFFSVREDGPVSKPGCVWGSPGFRDSLNWFPHQFLQRIIPNVILRQILRSEDSTDCFCFAGRTAFRSFVGRAGSRSGPALRLARTLRGLQRGLLAAGGGLGGVGLGFAAFATVFVGLFFYLFLFSQESSLSAHVQCVTGDGCAAPAGFLVAEFLGRPI